MRYRTSEIAEAFRTFYTTLYTIRKGETQEEQEIREYLKEANLPKRMQETVETLEDPITQGEINQASQETPGGKSSGPDGLPIKYYKKFKDLLIPEMCIYFNKIGETEEVKKESLLANISIIAKTGKDSTLCSNNRPIALLI